MLVYTFGIVAKPLAAELGVSRTTVALAFLLLDVVVLFAGPGAGRLVDRYGARRVIVPSLVGLSACLVGLAVMPPPAWHFQVMYGVCGVLGVGTTPVTYARVVANWFDRRRGLALGLAMSGVGLGTFFTTSFAQYLVERGGWRLAYLGLAGSCLVVAVPVVALFLRTTPEEVGLAPDGDEPSDAGRGVARALSGATVREAFGSGTFWTLNLIFVSVAAAIMGATAHLVPMLTDSGVSGRWAAMAASVFGAAALAGRVGNGYLVDRFFAPRVAAVVFAGAAAGIAMLWVGATGGMAMIAAALLGLATGAEGDVMPFLISRYFGMRSMAELFGCTFGGFTMGNAAGRYLFAAGFDATGSYKAPLACAFAAMALAALGCLTLGAYRTERDGPDGGKLG
jgi:MFS family permease